MTSPVARIFLSSTFRDFGEERDLLVRRVFPALRARLRERFVELVDVDLRWGITAEQAERGEVLPICLAEIDRARPWFVGMLGDRYGWTPEPEQYQRTLIEQRPWLTEYQGGKSVTELEILHGVLNEPAMAGRALFYFRDQTYAEVKGGDYVSDSVEDAQRLEDLKNRIRQSGFPVVEDYPTPEALAERLEADLWALLDAAFPVEEVPDAFSREERRHEAYGAPRRRLYLGGEAYIAAVDAAVGEGAQRVLVTGQSGGGKSALIANWSEGWRTAHPDDQIHVWYLGASADAAMPASLVRNLLERIKRVKGTEEEIPGDPQALYDSIPTWLAYASAHAGLHGYRWVIVLDALNGLTDLVDLRWWPAFLPERVQVLVSCLPGPVLDALEGKGEWHKIEVEALTVDESRTLLRTYLGQYNKVLASDLEDRALAHSLAIHPLFLRTLAEELRLFGSHEELSDRLDAYLTSITVDDLFERVLERIEGDCGADVLRKVMVALWASRAGLTEAEILAYADLVPATWASIRWALGNALEEPGGRIAFAHDYMRLAVSDRYLAGNNTLQDEGQSEEARKLRKEAHTNLAEWFEARLADDIDSDAAKAAQATAGLVGDARAAEEIPFQWQAAREWERLRSCLTDRDIFEVVFTSRPKEELLQYWHHLEAFDDADISHSYRVAIATWREFSDPIKQINIHRSLFLFLHFAGYSDDFTLKVVRRWSELCEATLGRSDPQTAQAINDCAVMLDIRGEDAEANKLYLIAAELRQTNLGDDHVDTAESYHNLAGRYDFEAEAEELYLKALEIRRQKLGKGHPLTLETMMALAACYDFAGRKAEAEEMFRDCLKIARALDGTGSLLAADCEQHLAIFLRHNDRPAEALPHAARALEIVQDILGPRHADVGRAAGIIANAHELLGDVPQATTLFKRALEAVEQARGLMHPDTIYCRDRLAEFLMETGQSVEAASLLRQKLAHEESAFGANDPIIGFTLERLGQVLVELEDKGEAEKCMRRALAIAEKAQGPEHPETGNRLNNLALLLQYKGDYASAELLLRRALAIRKSALGSDHPDVGSTLYSLGLTLAELGQDGDAEVCFKRELDIVEKNEGGASASYGVSLYNLGNFLAAQARWEEAEALLRQELDITQQIDGAQSVNLAKSLHTLGVTLRNSGKLEEASLELHRALAIWEAQTEDVSSSLSGTLSALGKVYALQGEKGQARAHYMRGLEILQAQAEPDEGDIDALDQRLQELDDD